MDAKEKIMNNKILCMLIVAGVFILGFSLGMHIGIESMERQAVQKHAAQYNPKSAKFEWIHKKD